MDIKSSVIANNIYLDSFNPLVNSSSKLIAETLFNIAVKNAGKTFNAMFDKNNVNQYRYRTDRQDIMDCVNGIFGGQFIRINNSIISAINPHSDTTEPDIQYQDKNIIWKSDVMYDFLSKNHIDPLMDTDIQNTFMAITLVSEQAVGGTRLGELFNKNNLSLFIDDPRICKATKAVIADKVNSELDLPDLDPDLDHESDHRNYITLVTVFAEAMLIIDRNQTLYIEFDSPVVIDNILYTKDNIYNQIIHGIIAKKARIREQVLLGEMDLYESFIRAGEIGIDEMELLAFWYPDNIQAIRKLDPFIHL